MAFIFIVGTHDFTSPLKGYESTIAQCLNCGNWSARPISSWQWFTVCWVPIIPLGGKHQEIACPICRFRQDLQVRPDVQSQINGGGGFAPGVQGAPVQGWGGVPPQNLQQQQQQPQAQPQQEQQQQQSYYQPGQGQPQYK